MLILTRFEETGFDCLEVELDWEFDSLFDELDVPDASSEFDSLDEEDEELEPDDYPDEELDEL